MPWPLARGPSWRTVFGNPAQTRPTPAPTADHLVGLAWHHALHACISIQRNRLWQAEHWIGVLRSHVISLACLRLGHPTSYAKGAHLLPADLTDTLEATLVRTLDPAELYRALTAATNALIAELEHTDPALANRLLPALIELAGNQPRPAPGHES